MSLAMMSRQASLMFAVLWGLAGLLSSLLTLRSGNMIFVVLASAALIPTVACRWSAWLSRGMSDFRYYSVRNSTMCLMLNRYRS